MLSNDNKIVMELLSAHARGIDLTFIVKPLKMTMVNSLLIGKLIIINY